METPTLLQRLKNEFSNLISSSENANTIRIHEFTSSDVNFLRITGNYKYIIQLMEESPSEVVLIPYGESTFQEIRFRESESSIVIIRRILETLKIDVIDSMYEWVDYYIKEVSKQEVKLNLISSLEDVLKDRYGS